MFFYVLSIEFSDFISENQIKQFDAICYNLNDLYTKQFKKVLLITDSILF
jgi:hypothetical protein